MASGVRGTRTKAPNVGNTAVQSLSLWRWLTTLPATARLAKWRGLAAQVETLASNLSSLNDAELRRSSLALQYRAAAGEPLERLLPEGFALIREASGRALGMRHFATQLLGGAALHSGSIAEMQTGEGKTLTATLPLYLAALAGKGAHLATANDYLAKRDAEFVRPSFALLGMSVGAVTAGMPDAQRREAYACDVTYGTAKEFGFDFLRDRLRDDIADVGLARFAGDENAREGTVQRMPNFLLIDEADSILLDEARTPLIISGAGSVVLESVATCHWAAEAAAQFKSGTHYELNAPRRTASLSGTGRQLVRSLARPDELAEVPLLDLYEAIELALQAAVFFHCDRQYVVRDGEVLIIDENTGRPADGRHWRGGLHQAIEAKEGLDISAPGAGPPA